jgi:hypothetical protein
MQRIKTSLIIVPDFISKDDAENIIDLAEESSSRFNSEVTENGNQISTSDNSAGNMGWEEAPTKLRNGSPYYIPSFSANPKPMNDNGFQINYRENTELWALTDKHIYLVSEHIKSVFGINDVELMAAILRKGDIGACMPPHQDGPVLNGDKLINIDFSCFVFLNDNYEGGAIRFEELGISWKPVAGSAVFLSNTSTKLMVHEIEKVTSGQRFSINTFFRAI